MLYTTLPLSPGEAKKRHERRTETCTCGAVNYRLPESRSVALTVTTDVAIDTFSYISFE